MWHPVPTTHQTDTLNYEYLYLSYSSWVTKSMREICRDPSITVQFSSIWKLFTLFLMSMSPQAAMRECNILPEFNTADYKWMWKCKVLHLHFFAFFLIPCCWFQTWRWSTQRFPWLANLGSWKPEQTCAPWLLCGLRSCRICSTLLSDCFYSHSKPALNTDLYSVTQIFSIAMLN